MNKEFLYKGKKICYQVVGEGKPVVLIHGFGEDGEIWKPPQTPPKEGLSNPKNLSIKYPLLPEGFQFIIPDLPGSGKSELIDDMKPPQTPPKEGISNPQNLSIEHQLLPEGFQFIIPDLPGSGNSEMIDDMKPPQTPPKEGISNPQNLSIEYPLLPNGFQLIIPNLPGSGNSEIIEDMSMEGMAEVIKCIIDEESSEIVSSGSRVALIGHSMGGYITLAFAEKYPEYLNAFGLFHSTAYADSEEKKSTRMKGIEFINRHGAFEFLKTVVPYLFSPESKDKMPNKIESFINGLHNFSPDALVSYYEAMMQRPDRCNVLKMSKVPVLFIFGEFDVAVPLKDGLELCHLPEKSYIHILHKSGHMGMLEETEECNRVLEKFMRETLFNPASIR